MSLYNMIHGVNPAAGMLLGLAGFKSPDEVGRFRDAYVEMEGDEPLVAIYTRNGGGNRDHWDDERDEGPECPCTGCTITYALPARENYVRDYDDDFDCTYATVLFHAPEEAREALALIATPPNERPDAVWQQLIGALERQPHEIPDDAPKGALLAKGLLAALGEGHQAKEDTP